VGAPPYITPPFPNQQNQVLPTPGANPYRNQMVFSQMIGAVMSENPDLDPSDVQVELNSIVRQIYDRREWYGLMIRGQISTTGFTVGGSVTATQGSNAIVGSGTTWTGALTNQQFRLGFNTPPYNINLVDEVNQILYLEMPWASGNFTSAGYFIAQYYYTIGPNIRYMHTAKNMIQAWRCWLNYNQQTLDSLDPWRATVFSPVALAQMPPDPNGNYQVELWPVPAIVQSLPWIAAVQPANLVNDGDALPPGIRADIAVDFGRSWAKTYRGPRWNKYYDRGHATDLRAKAERELLSAMSGDEDLYRQNILYPGESMQYGPTPWDIAGKGSIYAYNHGVPAEGGWDAGW
jgi:hypothetical protein